MSEYRPIVFEKEFAPRKVYDWVCLRESSSFQHLYIKQGPFSRHLLLFHQANLSTIQATLSEETDRLATCSELRIYSYPALPETGAPLRWRGGELRATKFQDRIFNTFTFVIDLRRTEGDLFAALHENSRRNIKRAEKEGFRVRFHESPDQTIIAHFFDLYRLMAVDRGLRVPTPAALKKMVENGNLLVAELRHGEVFGGTILLLYRCGPHAIYLYGVSEPGDKNKFGNLVQWEAIRYLKAAGGAWYDLGGVPNLDKENGLYRFKSALGGQLVGPSSELVGRTSVFRAAKWLKDRLAL